ncbi:MAG: potassium channel family protein [Sphingomicrobium sp.]
MTLRRKSSLSVWTQLAIRLAMLFAMFGFIVAVHWLERGSLKDSHDGSVSFTDVLYFTMISATTTGYGDIVPVSDRSRMFDAFIVSPIRIIFLLLLAGTAYTFAIKQTWNRWIMQLIQKNLREHIVLAGSGESNSKALQELLASGTDPRRIVVIDTDEAAIAEARECGVAVLQADASRNETLSAARIESASALLVSTGRDDSNVLIVLTARKMAPDIKISVTIRDDDNEDIARQAGADTVINPVSFSGLLLASSLQGPHRADYLADLASTAGRVMLRERLVAAEEVGADVSAICTGQPVRLIRDGRSHGPQDPEFGKLAAGDRILEIIDNA